MSEAIRDTDHAIHRQSHLGYEMENTYSGVLSFMRRRYTRNLTGVDVAVTGFPFDLATTFRTGARLGPAAIRAATVQLNEKIHPWGFGPCDRLAIVDYGDCPLDSHRPHTIVPSIVEHTRRIANACALLRPPATGVPVPGAKAGSRQSMSKVR